MSSVIQYSCVGVLSPTQMMSGLAAIGQTFENFKSKIVRVAGALQRYPLYFKSYTLAED
jgi:hypothetical protein